MNFKQSLVLASLGCMLASTAAIADTFCLDPAAPVPIPAVGTSGPMDTQTITIDCAGQVSGDVSVELEGSHTFSGDLEITVNGPDCSIPTYDGEPGGAADWVGQTNDFGQCDGSDSNGDWTLDIEDLFGGDSGELTQWCLTFDCIAPPPDIGELLEAIEMKLDNLPEPDLTVIETALEAVEMKLDLLLPPASSAAP